MSAPGRLRRLVVAGLLAVVVTGPVATGCAPAGGGDASTAATPIAVAAGSAPERVRVGRTAPAGPLPTTRVAPYVDLTTPPLPRLTDVTDATGQTDLVLAFVLAGPRGCTPTWGGTTPLSDPAVNAQVAALRARGATTTVSSGGALGDYLETACQDEASLAAAYGRALDAVGTDHLDVDVETDRGRAVSVDRIAGALALLQRQRAARISLTVQVDGASEGMSPDAVALVRAATDRGVAARVNLMVMNFDHTGSWSEAMLAAARTSVGQLNALWPGNDAAEVRSRVGLTFMLGRNDMAMTTSEDDARTVVTAAAREGYGSVGFWALARDNGGCPGTATETDDCSGIEQDPWAFTRIAREFTAP